MFINNIVDSLKKHPTKKYTTRLLSRINAIAVHHFAGDSTAERVALYHVNSLGWPGIAYHFVIDKDGTIHQTNHLETISYHVGQHNTRSVGVALNGNFQVEPPPKAQQEAARWLVNHLRQQAGLNVAETLGHREFVGLATACPGNTYKSWLPFVVSHMTLEDPTFEEKVERLWQHAIKSGWPV